MSEHDQGEARRATVEEAGAKGGKARAAALSPGELSEIGRKGAAARWAKGDEQKAESVHRATHSGEMQIGDIVIPCYVLENGTRVISHRGLQRSLGRGESGGAHNTAKFLGQYERNVPDGKDLTARISNPIRFLAPGQGRSVYGYEATVLADICEVILAARQAGVVSGQYAERMAVQCEILMRSFARVGIVALVDEATGYQLERARDELRRLLERYVSKELARWERAFEADFYKHLHRLKGWEYDPTSTKRSHCVAHITVDLAYNRIHPDLLKELKQVKEEKGRPSQKLHQWMTTEANGGGHPRLKQHLAAITALMRVAKDWHQFMDWVEEHHPKLNTTLLIPFPKPEDEACEQQAAETPPSGGE